MKIAASKLPLRTTLSVALLFCACWAMVATQAIAEVPKGWLTDLDEALEQAEARDAYLVVDLYADWCGWCKKLEREVFPSEEFLAFARGKVLLQVDVEDGAEGTELQARYGAYNLPTTLILDADLVEVGKVQGYAPPANLVPRFEAQVATWERLVARYPSTLEAGAASLRASLAQELHRRGDGRRAAALYAKLIDEPGEQGFEGGPAWLHYLMADAHRLARDFDAAQKQADHARKLAIGGDMDERLDLLAYQIAKDEGDCQSAKTTLQQFLHNHPSSSLQRQLTRTLQAMEAGRTYLCA